MPMSEGHVVVGVDPGKLYLRKELTQIRKAARVLRDPGTTSSWRKSPLAVSSTTVPLPRVAHSPPSSVAVVRNCHNGDGARRSGGSRVYDADNGAKQKSIFLHNWKNACFSSGEKGIGAAASPDIYGRASGDEDNGCSSVPCSLDEDSSSEPGDEGDDSRSGDSYMGDEQCCHPHPAPSRRRGRDAALVSPGGTPPIPGRRTVLGANKKKLKKLLKQQQQIHLRRKSAHSRRLLSGSAYAPTGLARGRDQSASLTEPSDDTEDYGDSDYLRRISASSPLIRRFRYKNSSHSSSKLLLKSSRKEDSSCTYNSTPALSTSSCFNPNPNAVALWDCAPASSNGGDTCADDDGHLDFPRRHGCGIPCYWSRRTTPKHRIFRSSSCSPSLSDTLRRKGSSILCGGQTMYHGRYPRSSSEVSNKRKVASKIAQGVFPLLTNGSSMGSGGQSDDDLSKNFGELGLEGLNRLDGRGWTSSCRSEEAASEVQALIAGDHEGGTPENLWSYSQKYRPMFFDELIGQNIVAQSLTNATLRGRIAPVYLFHGPRGTGKTSAARIFAAALNCLSAEKAKPCGICRECTDFLSSKSKDLMIIDGASKKAVYKIRYLFKTLSKLPQMAALLRYKIFVIDECHLLPSKTWVPFLKFLEAPLPRAVFIFITTDIDSMPRTVMSRCQKYLFNKIKDCDIITKLRKISGEENLDSELDALNLISVNADGSLRDAETMLEQLSLLGKMITSSLVNELLGVVSDDKLLELLKVAMSPDTAETVRRARELLDSGFDPTVIMSQMASLIMDLISGTYTSSSDLIFGGRHLTESELERLKHALKLLSDAEKQLRLSSERSTWFTAALLQLGSVSSSDFTQSISSRRQISKTTGEDPSGACKELLLQKHNAAGQCASQTSNRAMTTPSNGNYTKGKASQLAERSVAAVSHDDSTAENLILSCVNLGELDAIWTCCIGRCHSKTLRQLLHVHGRLLSISEVEGSLIAYVAFKDKEVKSRAERFVSSITDSIETVLRCNVEVRIILFTDVDASSKTAAGKDGKSFYGHREPMDSSMKSFVSSDSKLKAGADKYSAGKNTETEISGLKESREVIPMQRVESIIHDQKLETAWLQTGDRASSGSVSRRMKLEKNQVVPQDGIYPQSQMESSGHWEDELNHAIQKDHNSRRVVDPYPISPSLLHRSVLFDVGKDTMECESGSTSAGCSALFCWNKGKNRKKGKVKQGRSSVHRRIPLFGECSLPRKG